MSWNRRRPFGEVLSELKKEDKFEDALKIAYDFGAMENFSGDASDAFQFMSDKFLDGMPCDMANLPVESNDGEFRWIKRIDVHEQYYIYGSSEVYDEFRRAWMNGLLSVCVWIHRGRWIKYYKVDLCVFGV
ncbi:MAG: hypothetical protein ACLS8T_23845 [Anaerobutyricum sp.]